MKLHSINYKRILSVILCTFILTGSIGIGALAATSDNPDSEITTAVTETVNTDEEKAVTKDETVYVIAKADGSVDKIIVSDWLKNSLAGSKLSDKSELSDITNVKGDESFSNSSDNTKVWDAAGNDIYYRGSIKKELPVDISVSYKLDGKDIKASEIAGKSGKVTIRFDYKNNQYKNVTIDGKEEKIYVPFAMLTGVLLDSDNFRNVEVSNGKLVNDGDRTAVIGLAFPGLQENLDIDKEKMEIPDYVEITADVTNFEMENTVTVAVNDVFSNIDTEKLDATDDLSSQLTELTDAMSQLTDGSSKLYDGLCTLLDKSGELISGIDALASGAEQLKTGAEKLDGGAGQLSSGAKDLATGLETLADNNEALNGGAKQVFDTLLSTAESQLKSAGLDVPTLTTENYNTVLDNVIASLDSDKVEKLAWETARETVTAKVNEQKPVIVAAVTEKVQEEVTAKVTAVVYENVFDQVLAAMGMTREAYEQGVKAGVITKEQQEQIKAATDAQMQTEAVQALIKKNVTEQMNTKEVQAIISTKTDEQIKLLIEQNMQSKEVLDSVNAAIAKAAEGRKSVIELKAQINSYNEFYTGLAQYTAGVEAAKDGADKLSSGADTLKDGTAELKGGVDKLYDGILTLKNGAPALIDGITQLKDGAMKLDDGLNEFNEKGINKLVSAVDGDVAGLVNRVKATVDVSKEYKSFSGISDDADGNVKFIYRTDSISAEND